MRYRVLACDYDGTIATDGTVDARTFQALGRLRDSGRTLLLVTGRELGDLERVCPRLDLFAFVVGENGAVLYEPKTRVLQRLGQPPPLLLLDELRRRNVPFSSGNSIVATWEPHHTTVLEVLRDLGIEYHVVFNKGAVMVLPTGVNKQTGLAAALERLRLTIHECVGVGDAENDHAFLLACECAVAVSNAVPSLKAMADWVTKSPRGSGVTELIDRILAEDLGSLGSSSRHRVVIGTRDDGSPVQINPRACTLLVVGESGGGKSSFVTGLLERLAAGGYQVCIFDPEGDHELIPGAVTVGTAEIEPDLRQLEQVLVTPTTQCVVSLLGVRMTERPRLFAATISSLAELRRATGRPHCVVLDEAHHLLQNDLHSGGSAALIPEVLTLMVTVNFSRVPADVLRAVDWVLAVGGGAAQRLGDLALALGHRPPQNRAVDNGEALVWNVGAPDAESIRVLPGQYSGGVRHRRKYARGELGQDKSFFFRGADSRLNLRAQNLTVFCDLAHGVDADTWMFHLRRGDYSAWLRECVKDETLAELVACIEREPEVEAAASLERVCAAIQERYTAPA